MEKDITNTSTPEGPGKDTVDVLKDDPAELFEEIKSTENRNGDSEHDKDNRKFVSVKNMDESSPSESKCQEEKKDHDLGKLEANMDLESKSREGTLSNDTQQVDQAENRYEGKNIESKLEEERKQNTVENCGDIFKHDDLGEMDASIDVESKSQQGTLSNDIEQVDQDEGENFESEHEEERKQSTKENSGDIVKHDDMGEMDASAESKYQEGTLSNDIEQVEKRDEGKNSESKPEEQIKHTTGENCADSIKHDDLVEVDASMDLESKFQRGTLSNDIEQVDQSEKRDEGKNFESKLEEEREQAIRENCGDSVKQNDLDENRADSIKHDNLDEVDASIDLESKSRRETLSNDIGQVDQREKRDEGKNFESKPEKGNQTTGDNFGDSIKHDDLDEMEASMDPESKSERGTLSNDIEQLEQGEKREKRENFESKPEEERKQTNRGICGDSIEPDNLGEMVTTMDLGSKSQRSNAIQQVDQGEKRDEEKSKPQEERSQTVGENFADSIRHDDLSEMDANMDLEAKFHRGTLSNDIEQVDQGETAGETCGHSIKHDDLGEMEASMDLGSKYQRGFLSNDIEQVDQSEKRDEGKNFESKPGEERKQTGGENCSESIKLDDLGEIDASMDIESKSQRRTISNDIEQVDQGVKVDEEKNFNSKLEEEIKQTTGGNQGEEESGPVFYGTEVPGVEANRSTSLHSLGADVQNEESVWPEKARTLRNFVKEKGVVAVSTFLRAISGKVASGEEKDASDSANDGEVTKDSHKPGDRSAWNPLSYIMVSRNIDAENKAEQGVGVIAEPAEPIAMNGRVILYTKLGCQSCKEIRSFLYNIRLRYVEINVDVYPSRKRELEKFTGSCVVPKVLFNEIVIGGLSELKELDESGKLEEKIEYLITEAPSHEAPLTPLSGEDDMSSSGSVDELALIVRKMKESIVVKDRFYKMRRFPSCFLGSEAVNFLSEDQYLEREEAVEFGRKLASKLFFQHVLDENLFEDGNHLYWFMDDNPALSSQCHNIPRGIIELKPKPIKEIASRLRFLSSAIYEAYVSDDGKHVDYRTIHGSEEFARYLRIIQELQRVEFQDIPREEKLAFFINLYNMMIIHSVLVFGDTDGAAERRKVLGEFKYVIGGCSYSLSAIQHGILRCNQRPPFTLTKPFRVNDKRSKVALPYPEPLIHFALVLGTRSGPALRCYSPGDIDKELMDSARNFLRGGGLVIDLNARVVYLSKILKWFGGDFGKNEVEVLKHASNYLEPANSEALLELLASGQLKVIYQPYDWGLNL